MDELLAVGQTLDAFLGVLAIAAVHRLRAELVDAGILRNTKTGKRKRRPDTPPNGHTVT